VHETTALHTLHHAMGNLKLVILFGVSYSTYSFDDADLRKIGQIIKSVPVSSLPKNI